MKNGKKAAASAAGSGGAGGRDRNSGNHQQKCRRSGGRNADSVFSRPENVTNLGWDYSEKVSFTAGEDGWVCDQDGAFPVDETCLDKMLEVLTDVESTKTIENPENLDQYGLEIPVCVITVEDGKSHTLSIGLDRRGRPAVLLQRRWKRLSGGQRHYRKFPIWPV